MAVSEAKAAITRLEGGKIRTPIGTLQYVYLRKPDTQFKTVYKATLFFLDKSDEKFKAFVKQAKAFAKAYAKEMKVPVSQIAIPIKVANEKVAERVGVPVGTPYIETKTNGLDGEGNARPPIPVFGVNGKQDDSLLVYGGDIGRIEVSTAGWVTPQGKGIKFYLNAVQLLKSNWTSTRGKTFEEEEEYLVDESESPDPEADPDEFEDEADDEEWEADEDGDEEDEDPTAGLI